MFYFDGVLKKYEVEYSWDKALIYLEDLFMKNPTFDKLNSLVGFAWYYLIEGPIDSGKYEKDENKIAFDIWKKYLKIGFNKYSSIPSFCFISGYTLLLHGFYIDEYKNNNEQVALDILRNLRNCDNNDLKEIVECIFEYQKQKKFKSLKIKQGTLNRLFGNDSLLENYFKALYGQEISITNKR